MSFCIRVSLHKRAVYLLQQRLSDNGKERPYYLPFQKAGFMSRLYFPTYERSASGCCDLKHLGNTKWIRTDETPQLRGESNFREKLSNQIASSFQQEHRLVFLF